MSGRKAKGITKLLHPAQGRFYPASWRGFENETNNQLIKISFTVVSFIRQCINYQSIRNKEQLKTMKIGEPSHVK